MENYFQSMLKSLSNDLSDKYDSFKISSIKSSFFTQVEMLECLRLFIDSRLVEQSVLGASVEGKSISLYKYGNGPTKVMIWTQMHGDEPTATMAVMDIFNFLMKNPEHIISKSIKEKLTLLVIPMLNPDGAAKFSRRNAQMIDLNRDALALVTPEANILKNSRDKYQPEYGFNLHDQEPRYTAGRTGEIAAIALLAPAFDESRSDNNVRLRAKKIGSTLAQVINLYVPKNLAKWDDVYCSNAFGDNFQKWGTSTVLVESGGWRGDPNKFFIRKLNCIGLLVALYSIACGESDKADISYYEQIPFNMKLGCDYIIRNAAFRSDSHYSPVRVDVGINFNKIYNTATGKLDDFAVITEFGDLCEFTALEKEINAGGAELNAGLLKLDTPFPSDKVKLLLRNG